MGVVHVDVLRGDTTASPPTGTTCAACDGEAGESVLEPLLVAADLATLSVPYFFCAAPTSSFTEPPFIDDEADDAPPLLRSFFSVLYLACWATSWPVLRLIVLRPLALPPVLAVGEVLIGAGATSAVVLSGGRASCMVDGMGSGGGLFLTAAKCCCSCCTPRMAVQPGSCSVQQRQSSLVCCLWYR